MLIGVKLREEYFGIKTADLEIDDNGHFVMNFTVAGQRRYWRMQEMNNPADNCCDYVDIYFD